MTSMFHYKRYCWSMGTTSFRTKNFNKMIEQQLSLLNDFWQIPQNSSKSWNKNESVQTEYYTYMKSQGFVDGDAEIKEKDAREKTSGLVDIGLIGDDRKLTKVGEALLEVCKNNDFSKDNKFNIEKDSFIYLKQLLKTSETIEGQAVRPFIILIYLLNKFDYLTYNEFTYLLPLCISPSATSKICDNIIRLRNNETSIEDIILDILMGMNNYKSALEYFVSNAVTEDSMCDIGMNRKSRNYDKKYIYLYNSLYDVFVNDKKDSIVDAYDNTKKINIGTLWRNYLFDTTSVNALKNDEIAHLNNTLFSKVSGEKEFKTAFFKVMHLLKAKATLSDYLDLNRRYFKLTDVVMFEDGLVKLDIIPKCFFKIAIPELSKDMYTISNELYYNSDLSKISPCLDVDDDLIIQGINDILGKRALNIDEAHNLIEENRYKRFKHIIDTKFNKNTIIDLLEYFEVRNDEKIKNIVTDNADIPTIFEYILGVIWYEISERKGKILDYMNLSLDADLLPKTHAVGGEADIVYQYSKTAYYPEHSLLLEATLADGSNQRRMEMEPVSRHLGRHLLQNNNFNSYCVFITTYLDINVLSDFRARKFIPFYDTKDINNYVNGMKIIPIQTSEIKSILLKGKTYKDVYSIFESAYQSKLMPHEWYDNTIKAFAEK